jgi:hypothetical protein
VLHVKKFHLGLAALAFLPIAAVAQAGEHLDYTVTVDALSDRVFRGIVINDEPVLQTGFTLGWKGFSATAWANVDTTDNNAAKTGGVYGNRQWDVQEANYTLAYDHDFGVVALGGGMTYRAYPGQLLRDTQEAFVHFRADLPVVVSLDVVRDFGAVEGWYSSLGLSHEWQVVPGTRLGFGASCGWGNESYTNYYYGWNESQLQDAHATLSVSREVSKVITWRGYADYTQIVDGNLSDKTPDEDHLTVGTGGTFKF